MQPNLFERSLNLNRYYKYNRTSKFFTHFQAKLNFSETKFSEYNVEKKIGKISFKSQFKYRRSNSSSPEVSTGY